VSSRLTEFSDLFLFYYLKLANIAAAVDIKRCTVERVLRMAQQKGDKFSYFSWFSQISYWNFPHSFYLVMGGDVFLCHLRTD
jgi:hypothetical protein